MQAGAWRHTAHRDMVTLASGPGIAVSRGHQAIFSFHCHDVMMAGGLFYSKYFVFVVMHLYFPVAVTRVEIVTQQRKW